MNLKRYRLYDCINPKLLKELVVFWFGFVAAMLFTTKIIFKENFTAGNLKVNLNISDSNNRLYDESISEFLFNEVKILCWVFTHPDNHKTKAMTVKNTWGKRCNKLLFMSTEEDPEIGSIALPVENGRDHLWNKTKNAIRYVSVSGFIDFYFSITLKVHEHHLDDADWFMRADDDK